MRTPSAALDYPALLPLFQAARPRFEAVLADIEALSDNLSAIAKRRTSPPVSIRIGFLGSTPLLPTRSCGHFKPRLIVEIGSGHSTRFMARAVQDGALPTKIICIDPAPTGRLARLAVTHLPVLLQNADPAIFAGIQSGDVLFIDSSHIAMPGTDVDRLFLDILPRLAAGALVHIHDITLPYAYPAAWNWRGYNEQMVVGALLQGGGYELVFASHYRGEAYAGCWKNRKSCPGCRLIPRPTKPVFGFENASRLQRQGSVRVCPGSGTGIPASHILVQLVAKGADRDAENSRRMRPVALTIIERVEDQVALHVGHRPSDEAKC